MQAFGAYFFYAPFERTFTVPGMVFLRADLGYRLQSGRPRLCVSPLANGCVNDPWVVRLAPANRPLLLTKNTYGFTPPYEASPAR